MTPARRSDQRDDTVDAAYHAAPVSHMTGHESNPAFADKRDGTVRFGTRFRARRHRFYEDERSGRVTNGRGRDR